jgi:periplasmic divalent cation tolerance protein
MRAHKAVLVCTTVGSESEAEALARAIVGRRLAACVHAAPVRSTYRWKGVVQQAAEIALTAKTRDDRAKALVALIRARHSYELPEILVVPVKGGLPDYLRWVAVETEPAAGRRRAAHAAR